MSHNIIKILGILAASIAIMFPSFIFAQRIEVYFSKDVDTALCDSLGIEYLPDGCDVRLDSLLAVYIAEAESSVDMCVYNFDDTALVFLSPAIRDALVRGVRFRIVTDDGFVNEAVIDSLEAWGITWINNSFGLGGSGYMHCKFFIIDGRDEEILNDIVIISSSNLTVQNLRNDANNTIVLYWSELTDAFESQFNIYWGSPSDTPNPDSATFRSGFPDIIPHAIDGEETSVNLFFSPQYIEYEDSILKAFASADLQSFFCINRFTRDRVEDTLRSIFYNGVNLKGVFDQNEIAYENMTHTGADSTTFWNISPEVFIDNLESGKLHHKYLIVDCNFPALDPLVLVGSMNWSANGFYNNNECVLIIHSYEVAQKFFAEFATRYVEAGGSFVGIEEKPVHRNETMRIYPNPARNWLNVFPTGHIKIYDIRGQWVGDFCPPIMLCNLPAGEYIVRQGHENRKIIILP